MRGVAQVRLDVASSTREAPRFFPGGEEWLCTNYSIPRPCADGSGLGDGGTVASLAMQPNLVLHDQELCDAQGLVDVLQIRLSL